MGDLFEPMIELKQKLPDLKGVVGAVAKEPERIEIAAQSDGNDGPPKKSARRKSAGKSAAPKKRSKV
jgi:hypothetical protein